MFQRCVETTLDISGRFRSHKNNSRLTVSAGRILPKLDGFRSQQKNQEENRHVETILVGGFNPFEKY